MPISCRVLHGIRAPYRRLPQCPRFSPFRSRSIAWYCSVWCAAPEREVLFVFLDGNVLLSLRCHTVVTRSVCYIDVWAVWHVVCCGTSVSSVAFGPTPFPMCGCCGVIERTNAHLYRRVAAIIRHFADIVPRWAMLLAAAVSGRGCIFGGQDSLRASPVHHSE